MDERCRPPKKIQCIDAVRKQAAVRDEKPEGIDCRQTVPRCQGHDQLAMARRTKVRHNDQAAVRLACNGFQAAFDFQPFRMSTKVASAPSATDCRKCRAQGAVPGLKISATCERWRGHLFRKFHPLPRPSGTQNLLS